MELIRNLNRSDLFGAAVSGLCAIHCTLTPIFFVAKPVIESTVGEHAHGSHLWLALDYIFLVLSLGAVWYSSRHTNHQMIKRVLWIAWFVFAFGLLSEPFDLSFGKAFMYLGSITLVIAHVKNYRYCRKCREGIRH